MSQPTKVRIGATTWTVRWGRDATREIRREHKDKQLMGYCDKQYARITVAHDIPLDVQRDTLLHELLHAVYWAVGSPLDGKGKDLEERSVSALSPTLLMMLRDNPEVVEFLTGEDE